MAARLSGIEAITFDFGNTLVPVDGTGLRRVVARTARDVTKRLGPFDPAEFLGVWTEERERQFREEVPHLREVDLAVRFGRVLARLRGVTPPSAGETWNDAAAASYSTAGEIEWAVDIYSAAFVAELPAPDGVGPLLERLAGGHRLAILSNWPLAATIDRYVAAKGWDRHFGAIVVSQRVGTIKPHPAIFAAALEALGAPRAEAVLHVGDDWDADIVGAKEAGWRAAYLARRHSDSPLPSSDRDDRAVPDLEITSLDQLEPALAPS